MTIAERSAELRAWAEARLARVRPLDDPEGKAYPFLSTDWYGLLGKCFSQCEELLEDVVNTLLRVPAVLQAPKVQQVLKGSMHLKLTFAQAVAFLRDRVDFTAVANAVHVHADDHDAFLLPLADELAAAREFATRRNLFAHEPHSMARGNEECLAALTRCTELSSSSLVRLAARVQQLHPDS